MRAYSATAVAPINIAITIPPAKINPLLEPAGPRKRGAAAPVYATTEVDALIGAVTLVTGVVEAELVTGVVDAEADSSEVLEGAGRAEQDAVGPAPTQTAPYMGSPRLSSQFAATMVEDSQRKMIGPAPSAPAQ